MSAPSALGETSNHFCIHKFETPRKASLEQTIGIMMMKTVFVLLSLCWNAASASSLRGTNDEYDVTSPYKEDHPVIVTGEAHNATAYRRGLIVSGSRSILVLRVINKSTQPTVTSSQLQRYLFTDTNSLNRQMSRCSAGALSFRSAGVYDVHVDTMHTAQSLIAAAVRDGAKSVNGVTDLRSAADHVMVVLPQVSNYFAEAEVGNTFSYYNNDKAISLAVLMHEIGHNLNLHHAGDDKGDEYGDYSGNMGRSKVELGGPLLCFNAGNHWQLGWFPLGRKDYQRAAPTVPEKIKIGAFVDYPSRHGYPVMTRVGDMYMQYNRRKAHNLGTDFYMDQLVIVTLFNTRKTVVEAHLGVNQEFRGGGFVVRVCGKSNSNAGDYLTISLGKTYTDCNGSASTSNTGGTSSNRNPIFSGIWGSKGNSNPFSFNWGNSKSTTSTGSTPLIKWGSGSERSSLGSQSSNEWGRGFSWSGRKRRASDEGSFGS